MSGHAFAGLMLSYASGIAATHTFFLFHKYPRTALGCWLLAFTGMVAATLVSQ